MLNTEDRWIVKETYDSCSKVLDDTINWETAPEFKTVKALGGSILDYLSRDILNGKKREWRLALINQIAIRLNIEPPKSDNLNIN